jgi:hypothetical protein
MMALVVARAAITTIVPARYQKKERKGEKERGKK